MSYIPATNTNTASRVVRRDSNGDFAARNIAVQSVTSSGTISSTALSLDTGTITTSTPYLNLTQTWNSSGTVFTAAVLNVQDTASNANSLLLDLQVATNSKFKVDKQGDATCRDITQRNPAAQVADASILRRYTATTTATPAVVQNIALTSNYAYWFRLTSVANRQTTAEYAMYSRTFFVKVSSGGVVTVTETGQAAIHRDGLAATTDLTLVANGTAVDVKVTGEVGKNIGWATTIEYQGTIYQ